MIVMMFIMLVIFVVMVVMLVIVLIPSPYCGRFVFILFVIKMKIVMFDRIVQVLNNNKNDSKQAIDEMRIAE